MPRLLLSLLFLIVTFSTQAYSIQSPMFSKAIYGEDNRVEVYQVENPFWQQAAGAIAAMMTEKEIKRVDDFWQLINNVTQEDMAICSDERFAKQLDSAYCTGFLIDEDILLTAGHCIKNQHDCERFYWVFDHKMLEDGMVKRRYDLSQVFKCQEIIKTTRDYDTWVDFAIIRLDKKAIGRTTLKLRLLGRPENGTSLTVLGHPSGLPIKFSDDATIVSNDYPYFIITDLDTFAGNSGSPVFNLNTGEVEGILVAGSTDFDTDVENDCLRYHHCTPEDCDGEIVTRIENLIPFLPE